MKRFLGVLLSAVLVSGLLAGCSEPQQGTGEDPKPAATQGVTDTTVKVGGFAAQSGPVATIGISVRKGFEAYINHVNENGGVHGRKIEITRVVDDAFDGGKALAATKELVESDKVFALAPILGTPGYLASLDYMVEKSVPVIYPMTGVEQTAHPAQKNVFAVQPNNYDEAKLLTQYAVKELDKKKIAVFWQNSDMGKQGLKGIKEVIGDAGGELVYEASHEAKAVDFSTPVLNAKQKEAEVIILYTTLSETAGILKEMKKQGVTAQAVTSYVNADPVNLPQQAGDAAEGLIAGGWVPVADPEDPNVKQFYEIYGKYNNGELPNAFATSGFIAAELLVKGLEDAGKDLSQEKFIAALEALQDWDGIMARNLTYGPGERSGVKALYLNRVEKNEQGDLIMVQVNDEPFKLR